MFLNIRQKEKIARFGHILSGIIILLHGYEKYEHHQSLYIYFIVFGIIFLSISFLHHKFEQLHSYIDSLFAVIESIVIAIIAAEYFHEEKTALASTYTFASFMYLFAAFMQFKKNTANNKRH